jgi:hypothetical protein
MKLIALIKLLHGCCKQIVYECKVYIGSDNYAAAVPLITKITGSNYALHTNYNQLFWLIMIKWSSK